MLNMNIACDRVNFGHRFLSSGNLIILIIYIYILIGNYMLNLISLVTNNSGITEFV